MLDTPSMYKICYFYIFTLLLTSTTTNILYHKNTTNFAFFYSVWKPTKACTLNNQVKIVTDRIFDTIELSKYMKNNLIDGGCMHDLRYSGYKWKFI